MLRTIAPGLLVASLTACAGGATSDVLVADATDLAIDSMLGCPSDATTLFGTPCSQSGRVCGFCSEFACTCNAARCNGTTWEPVTDWSHACDASGSRDVTFPDTAPPAYCADAGEPLPGCACSVSGATHCPSSAMLLSCDGTTWRPVFAPCGPMTPDGNVPEVSRGQGCLDFRHAVYLRLRLLSCTNSIPVPVCGDTTSAFCRDPDLTPDPCSTPDAGTCPGQVLCNWCVASTIEPCIAAAQAVTDCAALEGLSCSPTCRP